MSSKEKKFQPMKMPAKKNTQKAQEQQNATDENFQGNNQNQNNKPNRQKNIPLEGLNAQNQNKNQEFQGRMNQQTISENLIKQGYIQSYIDFFQITKQSSQYQDDVEHLTLEQSSKMLELSDKLKRAEDYSKQTDKTQAIQEYFDLAETFLNINKEYSEASFFFKRCIHLAKNSNQDSWVAKSKLGYGKCFEYMDKVGEAIDIFERALVDTEQRDPESPMLEQISQELIQIYTNLAKQYEKNEGGNQIEGALKYYEKCQEVARRLNKSDEIANIQHRIGILYFKNGNYDKAIENQKDFLENCKNLSGADAKEKQYSAHAALAKCYLKKNMMDEAQFHLEKYYEGVNKPQTQTQLSDAAIHLATLWAAKGDSKKSLEFYKAHFESAKQAKDRKVVDKARVIYGIAKANAEINEHIQRVKNSDKNLMELLQWKQATKKTN